MGDQSFRSSNHGEIIDVSIPPRMDLCLPSWDKGPEVITSKTTRKSSGTSIENEIEVVKDVWFRIFDLLCPLSLWISVFWLLGLVARTRTGGGSRWAWRSATTRWKEFIIPTGAWHFAHYWRTLNYGANPARKLFKSEWESGHRNAANI